MTKKVNIFANLKSDFASGLVVFLVALPLCLGIAMASGAPLFSGIIAGVVGGIVIGFLSKSHLSVSGPAAGLTSIMLAAMSDLGAFELVLTAGVVAGILQLVLGFLRAGSISNYFPTNVIEGMLAGIGIVIISKQLPHAVGYDKDFEGAESFFQADGGNTISTLIGSLNYIQLGAVIITVISLAIMIGWDKVKSPKLKMIPGALIAVLVGVGINQVFAMTGSSLEITGEHLVSLPVPTSAEEFRAILTTPDFSGFLNTKVLLTGATIAVVASIETLLCIEAADRMDKEKRYTDTNVELKAQGIGNVISAMLGGLPMTSVVVRTSANANAGAKSKMSTIVHGVLLLVCALSIPAILNRIPLATLAAVLLLVGYKLAKPSMVMRFWKRGKYQFVPFIVTVVGVYFNLLLGVGLGIAVSIIFLLKGNLKRAYNFRKQEYADGDVIHIDLAQEVSFLNKAAIKQTLAEIPENSKVVIDASDTVYIAHDVLDLIREFKETRRHGENIKVKLIGFKKAYHLENTDEVPNHVSVEHKDHKEMRPAAKLVDSEMVQ